MFDVSCDDIEKLSDKDLRTLIGKLCELEAARECGSPSGITYGGHQNAADGGIDVRAALSDCDGGGFIPRPHTGFQCKAEYFPKSKILKEMLNNGELKNSIADLIELDGAYIIASSKDSVADTKLRSRISAMKEATAKHPDGEKLHVDFYGRQRLASWVNCFPGIINWVRQRTSFPTSGWQPFTDWSSSPDDISSEYVIDESVKLLGVRLQEAKALNVSDGIATLRGILRQPKQSVRLVGLSGVGKTRLAQALFDERIGSDPLNKDEAIYADLSDAPSPTPQNLLNYLVQTKQRCILIIDNCGVDLHRKLMKQISASDCSVSLVTVEYDISDDEPEHTDTFKLEPSSKELIETVVSRKFPELLKHDVSTIAEFSDGNSRVALALAATAEKGSSLSELNDTQLIERLFKQRKDSDPSLLRTAKALSLVYSFDGETVEDGSELSLLSSLTGETPTTVFGHVSELVRRRLVQKRSKWRAVLPHALAHKLAEQALDDFPMTLIQRALIANAPDRLARSFSRRLGCLHNSTIAQNLVREWMSDSEFSQRVAIGDNLALTVLNNIAPVSPEASLEFIKGLVSSNNANDLKQSVKNSLAALLRSLAFDENLFDEAGMVLFVLAGDEEKSNNSSDVSNVFLSLFYLHLSGTEAKPAQRINLLRTIAYSDKPGSKKRVIDALEAMLESNHFSSWQSFEFGSRRRSFGYQPKTYGETWAWYDQVLDFAYELSHIERFEVAVRKMVAIRIGRLVQMTSSPEKALEVIKKFASRGSWAGAWASLRKEIKWAQNKEDQPELVKILQPMADFLQPTSFDDMISTYVLPERYSILDLAEVELEADDEDGSRYDRAAEQIDDIVIGIGRDLSQDEALFNQHLTKILGSRSGRAYQVGIGIARHPDMFDQCWETIRNTIVSDKPEGNVSGFLSGFLEGVRKVSPDKAEGYLDQSLSDPVLKPFFVHMQFCTGAAGRGVKRLIKAAEDADIPTWAFRQLSVGRFIDDVDEDDLLMLLKVLFEREDGQDVAIDIFHMRLFSKRSDKSQVSDGEKKIGRFILAHVDFDNLNRRHGGHDDLGRIFEMSFADPEDDDEPIIRGLLSKLRGGLQSFKLYGWDYSDLLVKIAERYPRAFLDVMVEQCDISTEQKRDVFQSIRDRNPCPLKEVSAKDLLAWANEKPETRFELIAAIIRPWQSNNKKADVYDVSQASEVTWNADALEFARKAPDPKSVLSQYALSFEPWSWSGSRAQVIEARASILSDIFDDSDQELAAHAKALKVRADELVKLERKREEERARERDERFEW